MKKLLNKLTPNAVLALVIALCLFFSISVLAHNPDTYQAELETVLGKTLDDLSKCANDSIEVMTDIKAFQKMIRETCEKGGIIKVFDNNGNRILFYCSQVIES